MVRSWAEIERVEGFAGIKQLVEQTILPSLDHVESEKLGKDGQPKGVQSIVSGAFTAFGLLFLIPFFLLPDTFFGGLLRFILFPLMFFGTIVSALWLNRKKLTQYILRAHGRYQRRGEILGQVADHVGLTYVASPGNRPAILDWLASQSWVPPELREAAKSVGGTGEMVEAVSAIRESGLLQGNVIVIGSEKQKAQYEDQLAASLHFEDGFHGERGGIIFDILEWKESQDEAPDIYHLIIVLTAPRRSQGIIQLKSQKAAWWRPPGGKPMEKVLVGPDAFRAAYDVRSNDQVEAHALFDPAVVARMIDITHGETFRASAVGGTLVFDVAGEDRFAVLDPATGAWSEDSVCGGIGDLAEALALVDALATAFRVRRQPAAP
ncbi:MAG: hypothetical protein AAFQ22_07605 [Pseudomonadota bacterium]